MNLQPYTPPSERIGPIAPRRLTPEAQEARLIQLADIRIQRPLTDAELAEREDLERKQYFRTMNRERAYWSHRQTKGRAR